MNTTFIKLATMLNVCFLVKTLSMDHLSTNACAPKNLLENLLSNPLEQLEESRKLALKFRKEIDDISTIQKIKVLKKYEQQNPIFLLDEVMSECCMIFLLSKSYCKNYFQEIITDKLCEILSRVTDKSVCYVAVGSGALFQELIIAASVLKQKPAASLVFNFIDINYNPYIKNRISHKKEPRITEYEEIFDQKDEIDSNVLIIGARCKQFIRFLKSTFSKSTIFLNLFGSIKSYNVYLNKCEELPHLLSAVDILDKENAKDTTALKYKKLCDKMLKNNKEFPNIWLKYDPFIKEVALRRYYLLEKCPHSAPVFTYYDCLFAVNSEIESKLQKWYEGI